MYKICTFFVSMLSLLSLSAQITVQNTTFPAVGDTLRYAVDSAPQGIDMGAAGGPQTWDFTGLVEGSLTEIIYADATLGAGYSDFPQSNVYTAGQLRDHYYRTTANVFEELGYVGADQLNFGLSIASPYLPALPLRRAPMNFIDINTFDTDQTWAAPIGDFADSILPQIALLDSIRFRIHTNRLDVVDGFGTCIIPGGEFEVLREKRKTETETSIDVHTFLGWTSLSDLLGGVGGGLFAAIGKDTTLEYHFFSNTGKEEIAIASVDPTSLEVLNVQYKSLPLSTGIAEIARSKPEINTFPNPSAGSFTISCDQFVPGKYQLLLYRLNGALLKSDQFETIGSLNVTIDLPALAAGVYYYQVVNEMGEQVAKVPIVIQ